MPKFGVCIMKKILLSAIVVTTLLSSSAYVTSASAKTTTVSSSSSSSQKTSSLKFYQYRFLKLSDQQIKNAIAIGGKGYDAVVKFNKNQKLTKIEDTMKIWQPNVWASTPYFNIVRASFLKQNNYEKYTVNDGKKLLKLFEQENEFHFELETFGNSINYNQTINVVLKQGSKTIQPTSIDGKDELADMSDSWPKAPAYRSILTANFDINKIDFTKPAELIYLYAGKEYSVTYKVDFSKLK